MPVRREERTDQCLCRKIICHPYIRESIFKIEELGISVRALADPVPHNRCDPVREQRAVTDRNPPITSAEVWMNLQKSYS